MGIRSAALVALLLVSSTANAETVYVADDEGGILIDYLVKRDYYYDHKVPIKFITSCNSACTMYLTVRPNQICAYRTSQFIFHAAYGSSELANKLATEYMFNMYPEWVKEWIVRKGGLTKNLITMPYSYIKRHVQPC